MLQTLRRLADQMRVGFGSSHSLTEAALAEIDRSDGEGGRAFLRVYRSQALAAADAADRLRRAGVEPAPLAGLPIAIADDVDVAGDVTRGGSVALNDAPPAAADAAPLAALRAAGAVVIGRTSMSEFGLSAFGINPHYGTPRNPWDRAAGRFPGGAASGAAVAVADGMVTGALVGDGAGGARIPAALCGVTAFRPSPDRVPRTGLLPLAPSFDAVAVIARSVECCARFDAVLSGAVGGADPVGASLAGVRLAVPQGLARDDLDSAVGRSFERVLAALTRAGAKLVEVTVDGLAAGADPDVIRICHAEAYATHRPQLDRQAGRYGALVLSRLADGLTLSAAEYVDLQNRLAAGRQTLTQALAGFEAVVMPTVPRVAGRLAEAPPHRRRADPERILLQARLRAAHRVLGPLAHAMADPNVPDDSAADPEGAAAEAILRRNVLMADRLGGPVISLPCHRAGEAPVGLMVAGLPGSDRRTLALASAIEQVVGG